MSKKKAGSLNLLSTLNHHCSYKCPIHNHTKWTSQCYSILSALWYPKSTSDVRRQMNMLGTDYYTSCINNHFLCTQCSERVQSYSRIHVACISVFVWVDTYEHVFTICAHICAYVSVCACVCVFVHAYVYLCMRACVCVSVRAFLCVYLCVCLCVCVCVCGRVCVGVSYTSLVVYQKWNLKPEHTYLLIPSVTPANENNGMLHKCREWQCLYVCSSIHTS